jgi:hypothetical protein
MSNHKAGFNVAQILFGSPFLCGGIYILVGSLTGGLTSNSNAINDSPLLGAIAGLVFMLPGLWLAQFHKLWGTYEAISDENWNKLWIGLICAGMGVFIVVMSFVDDEVAFRGNPRWVAGLAGLVFVLGGILVLFQTVGHGWTLKENKLLTGFLGAVLLTAFGALATWVSMGPGERQFRSSVSFFINISAQGNETIGRLCFLPGALLLDFMAAVSWLSWFKALSKSSHPALAKFFGRFGRVEFVIIGIVAVLLVVVVVFTLSRLLIPRVEF